MHLSLRSIELNAGKRDELAGRSGRLVSFPMRKAREALAFPPEPSGSPIGRLSSLLKPGLCPQAKAVGNSNHYRCDPMQAGGLFITPGRTGEKRVENYFMAF
jgi:hypothetical protein